MTKGDLLVKKIILEFYIKDYTIMQAANKLRINPKSFAQTICKGNLNSFLLLDLEKCFGINIFKWKPQHKKKNIDDFKDLVNDELFRQGQTLPSASLKMGRAISHLNTVLVAQRGNIRITTIAEMEEKLGISIFDYAMPKIIKQ